MTSRVQMSLKPYVEILVVVVMEDAVWLPGLPPQRLESDAGVVDDAVIVDIEQHEAVKG